MLVSIIITNYNYEKYLGRCIRSCINQSLAEKDYEIIDIQDQENYVHVISLEDDNASIQS